MSDQTPPRSSYHHGDLRAQLIDAVRDLVETHGPDGFSVAEAARRAGVSSAAPYKHFRDRPALLRAVASEGMDRLRSAMEAARASHPPGSIAAIAAIGQAYVDFARSGPGVFRLVFGLTEGHEEDPHLEEKGFGCFAVVLQAVAAVLGKSLDDPMVQSRAYTLWTCVHGHSFLIIDRKTKGKFEMADEWGFLMQVTASIIGAE
ncbi:TetR/AcrR family transcriptional regulator [Tabrizicola sp. TH137]|uniref:TetR/AcrR family transcriptional regulator n=1 Tax=Tabrizicola sp. TH137 TaxID=2067452 RepID=UPI000C7DB126|nr:TetR/AcrR family transcriptional regulator [Tabrizicola sp. TH137]PLL11584.1 TetR/AcrR family transcriptional regulator [Tabrizicola sp. TH137]